MPSETKRSYKYYKGRRVRARWRRAAEAACPSSYSHQTSIYLLLDVASTPLARFPPQGHPPYIEPNFGPAACQRTEGDCMTHQGRLGTCLHRSWVSKGVLNSRNLQLSGTRAIQMNRSLRPRCHSVTSASFDVFACRISQAAF